MFLEIDKICPPFSVLHQFFPTSQIIWAQVAAKGFFLNPRWWFFKIKKECPAPQQ
jgi:hypothetical protein